MAIQRKSYPGGFIREVVYDTVPASLTLSFDTGRVLCYGGVPEWVFKKLVASPSPRSFWEDAIRDEYSSQESKVSTVSSDARAALDDLFKS
jgi:hypothetical protein